MKPKDDGHRDRYGTGAMRSDRSGRGRYELIPPCALKRLAIQYEHGAVQKGARNWELGFPISRAVCSAIGHIEDYLDGDRSEDHLAAGAWQLFAAMTFERGVAEEMLPLDLMDIPLKESTIPEEESPLATLMRTIVARKELAHAKPATKPRPARLRSHRRKIARNM